MPVQTFSTFVVRPKDLLILRLEFRDVNFDLPAPDKPGRISGRPGAYLIVHFQPQHFLEQAFYQASVFDEPPGPGDEEPSAPGGVRWRLAGPSRLVFRIPVGLSFDYTLAGVLEALQRLPQNVSPVAGYQPALSGCLPGIVLPSWLRFPAPPAIVPPAETETAIEAPYHLILSPDPYARWSHAAHPVTRDQVTELWHTRLGTLRSSGESTVRAIWSPDFIASRLQPAWKPEDENSPPYPFRASLDARQRNQLVHLTSNWYLGDYTPLPVDAERLMLTTLGAWLRLQGDWDPPSISEQESLTVEQWRHIATMGRDHYVRVIEAGYLFPFGHRASLVQVTERKFSYRHDADVPGMIAYLYQRYFILVRQPTRGYGHHRIPFRTVTIKTRVTPDLGDPSDSQVGSYRGAFWPRVVAGSKLVDFHFLLSATDWEGRTIEFSAPLIFVDKNIDGNEDCLDDVISHYSSLDKDSERRCRAMCGQAIAFAPSADSGDTTLETASISFDAIVPDGAMATEVSPPHFSPTMAQAEVDIPAVKQMLGGSARSTIGWEDTYAEASGDAMGNAGHVFALINSSTPLDFPVDKAGGLVAPSIGITGLSRALGPVGGSVEKMVAGDFHPQDIFGPSVKLFGSIELRQIVEDHHFYDAANASDRLPVLVSLRDGNVQRTTYKWHLSGVDMISPDAEFVFERSQNTSFRLKAIAEVPFDGSPPTASVEGELANFSVLLVPSPEKLQLARVTFDSFKFTSEMGKKPDVDVRLGGIKFLGILEYVANLIEALPLDGFSDPPSLAVRPDGIDVGYSFGIPTVGLGMMSVQNVSVAAGLYLPFDDKPLNLHFAFCERHQPFLLTVSLFGGGGFFAIDIGIDGVRNLEAALEFGAAVALNLGVARGAASVMGGFYFQAVGDDCTLTGYFRASGALSVLGIITVSCEFYLGLNYTTKEQPPEPHAGTMWGQASLTVKIKILFFSKSVSIAMEREFAGSDPSFQQLVSPADWAVYCDAFADYP
jgi:hypothetical protein